jgi:hypothetical protein
MDNSQQALELAKMARAYREAGMASSAPYTICCYAQPAAEKYPSHSWRFTVGLPRRVTTLRIW